MRSTGGSTGRCRGGCFNRIRFKTRDKNINADDARQRSLGKGWTHPPGKVLTSEGEEAAENNERIEVEREQRGS